jgi:hypothetical protein
MGWLSKVWKGVKKTVKKIGKGIKSAVGKVGKFMDKIGIVGQIGLALIMPGIGGMLGQWAGNMMAYQGFGAGVVNAAGSVLNAAVNIGSKVSSVFSTVTEGVTNVMGEVAGATINELGLGDVVTELGWDVSTKSFANVGTVFNKAVDTASATVGDLFSKSTLTATNKFAVKAAEEAAMATMASAGAPIDLTTEGFTKGIEASTGDFTSSLSLGTEPTDLFTMPEIATDLDVSGITLPSSVPTPSLLDRGITAVKELPSKLGEKAIEKIEELPETIAKEGVSIVKDVAREKAYDAAGIQRVPTYNSYKTSIPSVQPVDLDSGYASGIQFTSPMPSAARLAQNPYGYGSMLYNENTYAARLRAMGG